GEHGEKGATEGRVVHLVENLVLNPARSGGSRFLLLSVGFAVKDDATAKTLADRDPELRDVIIRCFGAKTVDELVDVALRDSLKVELQQAVGERFGPATVSAVYFPQFVIQ
ncbi:MAG TPA: flagellar basal body-associated FliL family protein, partial [Gemmatimonadaceae bacterium]